MAKEKNVLSSLKELGFNPNENSAIIVSYAVPNLSAKVANFLSGLGNQNQFFVLQICENEIVLLPLTWSGALKKEVVLQIPIDSITSVEINEKGFDYILSITYDEGTLDFSVQQKELSAIRMSGGVSNVNLLGTKNWHTDNLDTTFKKLRSFNQ